MNDSIYTELKEELRRWNRPFAGSVIVAKSFRGEGEEVKLEGQQQQQQAEVDPFEGIDWDNLPESTKTALTKAKTDFANLQKDKTDLTKKATDLDNARRIDQGLKEKFRNKLLSHNIDPDAEPQKKTDPRDQRLNTLTEKYIKRGLPPEQAKTFAEMNLDAIDMGREEVLKEIGGGLAPHLQNLGNMSVERMLTHASRSEEFQDYLQNEDVYKAAHDTLTTIAFNGGAIDNETLTTCIRMAVGEAAMKGKLNPTQSTMQNQQTRTFGNGGNFSMPPMTTPSRRGGDGMPVPANDDTAKAVNKVVAAMKRGLPSAKGK